MLPGGGTDVLYLGGVGSCCDLTKLDQGAQSERPTLVGEEVPGERMPRHRCRADVGTCGGIYSGDAYVTRAHARQVVDNYAHQR